MSALQHNESNRFQTSLKGWRKQRKMSQLDLALAAEVSQRHVSWLETGRSKPSRDMVVKLAEALDVPFRDRNAILNSAGFASLYTERRLEEPEMQPVSNILTEMLEHHEPYPAFVLDRHWNIKMKNQAAGVLFELLGDPEQVWRDVEDNGEFNIALLSVHPNGLRRFISNWDDIAAPFLRRLKREALESGDPRLIEKLQLLLKVAGPIEDDLIEHDLFPVLPLEIDLGEFKLKLCSVISTFGTAQDITADELRIETFYPADEQTRRYFTE